MAESIEETCLWFFEMCALIAEHPNTVPIGLGNSWSVDMSGHESDLWEIEEDGVPLPRDDEHALGDDDDELAGSGTSKVVV